MTSWNFLVLTGVQKVLKQGYHPTRLPAVAMVSHDSLRKQVVAIESKVFIFPISGSKGDHKTYTLHLLLFCYTTEKQTHELYKTSYKQYFVKKQTFLPLFAITP